MANKVDATVEGGELFDRILRDLPIQLRDEVMPKATRAAAEIVQTAARQKINNNRSGRNPPGLARTIIIKVMKYDYTVTAVVGPAYLGVNHAHLLEFGHRLVRKIRQSDGSITKVEIGFVKAYPFLRPAGDETVREQRQAIIDVVKNALQEYTS